MKALITGITGQDGSYLAELLLSKGYEVYGLIRRSSVQNTARIAHLPVTLLYGDLSDGHALSRIIREVKPDEIYNLAAQSNVKISFNLAEYTADVVGTGVLRLLEAVKNEHPRAKIYQAGSSEMYGKALQVPQTERTPFNPRSPYACAKVFAHQTATLYREAYGLFVCNGIMFNHESPRRGEDFVTRKTTKAVARIALGKQKELYLGNLEAKRDWGYAPEYVEAMWRMLQHNTADDYVIATNETHSVREFVEEAFSLAGLNWKNHVKIDTQFYRPAEVDHLIGDYSKAKRILGWRPQTTFKQLVKIMVEADLEAEKTNPQ